jgi:hypothetical protein
MMDWLKTRIAQSPQVAQMVGHALFGLGGFLIVAGLIARAGMLAINSARAKGNLPALPSISEACLTYPLWFVPEGRFGYFVAVLLAGLGIYVTLSAKSMLKHLRSGRRQK